MPQTDATEAEADKAVATLKRMIEAAEASNQAGENAVVLAARAPALLKEIEELRKRYGLSGGKIAVHALFGKAAGNDFAEWDPDTEALPDEVGIGFKTYEFDTQAEADAFSRGMEETAGWERYRTVTDDEAASIIAARDRGASPSGQQRP